MFQLAIKCTSFSASYVIQIATIVRETNKQRTIQEVPLLSAHLPWMNI